MRILKLNLDIIRDYLPETCKMKLYGPGGHSRTFSRPLLYESGMEFQEDTLYVARSETLPEFPPRQDTGIISVGALPPREWLYSGVRLLTIQNSPGMFQIFNQIHEIYNKFDVWDEQLRDELEKETDFDIRRVLCLGTEMFQRIISVSDYALNTIFLTKLGMDAQSRTVVDISDSPSILSMEFSEKVKEVCQVERMVTVPYLTAFDSGGEKYYCNNLYPTENFSGCISVSEGKRPFRESDFALMDYFFSIFQKAFAKHLRSFGTEDNTVLDTLRSLFDHTLTNSENLTPLTLHPGESWRCFQLRERRGERSYIREYMYATINGTLPGTAYAIIQYGEIVGLFREKEGSGKENEEARRLFGETLSRMGYIAGFSNTFTNLGLLDSYLLQARYAAEQGADKSDSIHYFQNYILSYMLEACTRDLPPELLFSRGLALLQENDRKKNTEYVRTLDVYLLNETHISQTAEALFIHRSSLLKRLDKIQRLLGENLDDPSVRLYYRICLALLRRENY